MKTLLKKPASLLAILTMVLAMALTVSCSDSSGGNDILGSCMATDHGDKVCVEFLGNFSGGATAAQQSCTSIKGTWSAGTACPEKCTTKDENLDEGGILYACPMEMPATAIQLTAENWVYSSIDTEGGEVWYKFNASVGHSVWWVDSDSPELGYTLDIRVQAYDGNGNELFNEDSGYPGGHFVNVNGIVYLRVTSYTGNGTGTFGILYGVPAGSFIVPTNAIALTAGQWKEGSITSANEVWYKFDAVVGSLYYVWWDDSYEGSSAHSTDVYVSAWASDTELLIDGYDNGYAEGAAIAVSSNGPVYIKVVTYSEVGGTFEIAYSNGRARPANVHGIDEASAIPLTAGSWKRGNIFSEDDEIFYKFNATANTDYYLWLDDFDTDGYLVDAVITVMDSEGNILPDGISIDGIDFYDPKVIRLTSSGTVYLSVERMSDYGEGNAFRIRYNTIDDSYDLWDYYNAPSSAPAKISSAKKVSSAKKINSAKKATPAKAPKAPAKS